MIKSFRFVTTPHQKQNGTKYFAKVLPLCKNCKIMAKKLQNNNSRIVIWNNFCRSVASERRNDLNTETIKRFSGRIWVNFQLRVFRDPSVLRFLTQSLPLWPKIEFSMKSHQFRVKKCKTDGARPNCMQLKIQSKPTWKSFYGFCIWVVPSLASLATERQR